MLSISEDGWLEFFPARLRSILQSLPPGARRGWQEIRLRQKQPLLIRTAAGETWLTPRRMTDIDDLLTPEDLQTTFALMTRHSIYALEEELRRGFITLPGGHRLGFTGRADLEQGRIRQLRQISSLNLRLARAVPGAARSVLPHLVTGGRLCSTLILSPPGCGKTTMLRDIVRLASTGVPGAGLPGQQVSLVDERSEVAGSFLGRPQLDVGPRTDVLDGAAKAEGMLLMLRAMCPQVLATDEIGRAEDAEAIAEAAKAGVSVVATAHAAGVDEAALRPSLAGLLTGHFQRIVVLNAGSGPGTIGGIFEPRTGVNECSASWVPCSSWSAPAASGI